ncbi:MAG: OmpA family protein [Bacteroidia bacterium]|nr:OmpA family protein [Bacteroidia bacterium]
MKSHYKFLIFLFVLSGCGKSGSEKPVEENPNKALYDQVMEVHDEIMPKMEVIYNLKESLEERIENTANIGKTRGQQLEQTILNLDSARGSMLHWMQNFEPLSDSLDQEKARDYLLTELERVKQIREFITENITQAESVLSQKEAKGNKKASNKIAKVEKETAPTPIVVKPAPIKEQKPVEPVVVPPVKELPKKDSITSKPIVKVDSSANKMVAVKPVEKKPDGKPFYFNLVNAESGNKVSGEVHVVEAKATQYLGYKGNELVYLTKPRNVAGVYIVSIAAPGYRPEKLVFNYEDPLPVSSGVGEQQEIIITFEMTHAKRGDYIDFNEVRFFRNSTILEPHSQNELNGLVDLMKENENYKIKIHGHCNGDDSRPIITLGTSTDIFNLDPTHNKRETATAKRLTELRAETVRDYLVSQGIELDRLSIKGEGGKMMIYPRTSTLANRNDRVEIEVLKGR